MTTFAEKISKSLGSENSYAVFTDQYNPEFLNVLPRSVPRDEWGIDSNAFNGVDVWHCWEASFLRETGEPVSGVVKFVYSAHSPFMVESKSAKLFFNSFDMCKIPGSSLAEAIDNYVSIIKKTLESVLGVEVLVAFHQQIEYMSLLDSLRNHLYILDGCYSYNGSYLGNEDHLKKDDDQVEHGIVFTNSLRSRCRHTKQKDTGAAFIASTGLSYESIYHEIVSMREMNEFHEFCAERLIYKMLQVNSDSRPIVALTYNRRGSLDINPVRWDRKVIPPDWLNRYIHPQILMKGTMTQ